MAEYDLFVSYRRKDADRVQPLVAALRECGLRVWLDQSEIHEFAAITDTIRRGLADSRAFLAWYSADYPKSRPCQMELTAAFIEAQHGGDVRQRILVVNPEPNASHVLPVELADEQHLPGDEPGHLAARVAEHVRPLHGTLGAMVPSFLPPQYGRKLVAANRFVGRLPDLWAVHSALHGRESAIISGSYGPGVAVLSGLGGAGKSMLAEEYALRFAAAYPGGIFWLRALGNDDPRTTLPAEEQESVRQGQFRDLAIALRIVVQGFSPAEVEAALASKLAETDTPFLWVVDDVPAGLDADAFRRWLAPASSGKTLLTTRSREYGERSQH